MITLETLERLNEEIPTRQRTAIEAFWATVDHWYWDDNDQVHVPALADQVGRRGSASWLDAQ